MQEFPIPPDLSSVSKALLSDLRRSPDFRLLLQELTAQVKLPVWKPGCDLTVADWAYESGRLAGFRLVVLPLLGYDPADRQSD